MLLYKVPILKKRQSSKIRKKYTILILFRDRRSKIGFDLKLENGNNTAIHLQNCSKEKFYGLGIARNC